MRRALSLLLLPLAACLDAPYTNLAEPLDLGMTLAGQTWVASVATPDGTQTRLLTAAPQDSASGPAFSYTAVIGIVPVYKLQGFWSLDPDTDRFLFSAGTEYAMADESSTPVARRQGAQRRTVTLQKELTARLEGGTLVLSGGDGTMDGSYVPLQVALSRLGRSSPSDLSCAFQVYNLTIVSSQVRIPGFNSALVSQYTSPATFVGEQAGSVRIAVTDLLSPLTDITYAGYSDFSGVFVEGTQWTKVNLAGDGYMYGSVAFRLEPVASGGGAAPPPLVGTVTYGESGGGGTSIRLTNGNVTGGSYAVSLDGGVSGPVDGVTWPPPPLAECLGI